MLFHIISPYCSCWLLFGTPVVVVASSRVVGRVARAWWQTRDETVNLGYNPLPATMGAAAAAVALAGGADGGGGGEPAAGSLPRPRVLPYTSRATAG